MQLENTISQIHGWLGNTSGYYAIIMVVWGLWRYFRKQGIDSEYWGALVIEECLIALHCLLGVLVYFIGKNWDTQLIHILCGVACALILPIIYASTKRKKDRSQLLIYILFNAILALLVWQAIRTSIPIITING